VSLKPFFACHLCHPPLFFSLLAHTSLCSFNRLWALVFPGLPWSSSDVPAIKSAIFPSSPSTHFSFSSLALQQPKSLIPMHLCASPTHPTFLGHPFFLQQFSFHHHMQDCLDWVGAVVVSLCGICAEVGVLEVVSAQLLDMVRRVSVQCS
jgi:hypothetical protein